VPALPAEAAHLGNCHTLQAHAYEGFFHLVHFVVSHDRFDFFHFNDSYQNFMFA
jgi:hypothetical protein